MTDDDPYAFDIPDRELAIEPRKAFVAVVTAWDEYFDYHNRTHDAESEYFVALFEAYRHLVDMDETVAAKLQELLGLTSEVPFNPRKPANIAASERELEAARVALHEAREKVKAGEDGIDLMEKYPQAGELHGRGAWTCPVLLVELGKAAQAFIDARYAVIRAMGPPP
jgi:hypothetical protein